MTAKTLKTRGEVNAYISGLERRAEVQRIIASPEYRSGDLAAHARVRQFFVEAHGTEPVGVAPIGPGEAAANPFGRSDD